MSEERVIVRQGRDFRTEFLAVDPTQPLGAKPRPVRHIDELTPYGMLLAGLGSCTGVVLHTYAQHHDVDLQEVELDLRYERIFREDCIHCEEITDYKEFMRQEVTLKGDLTEREREKLLKVSRQCPIHKMFESGIPVKSGPSKTGATKKA